MKYTLFILLVVAVAACVSYADSSVPNVAPVQPNLLQASLVQANLAGSGDFSASAVLWFSGTDVTAQLSGDLSLNGDLTLGATQARFSAEGTLDGEAIGDSNTLMGSGWATFSARGTLASGEAIMLHGAIKISADDVELSADAAGSGTGSLYIVLILPDQTLRLRGTVTGTASGGFGIPDDPQTMQLDATGSFVFVVATRDAALENGSDQEDSSMSELSWNTYDWPQEISDQFAGMMQEELE
ncbi:MAG: hypothetical protein U9Q94_04935 [Candidatus Bipolaricaulota bacterium]|nr:hypothetical protein [Candidatus Bipolaricaulota bacterium]